MKIKTKVFLDLLLKHSGDPRKVKRVMSKDQRLTRDEKSIINCFLLMRANKNKDGLNQAEEIKEQPDPFVESMRHFVLAGLLNNLSQHKKALLHFQLAYKILPKNVLPHFEFVNTLNIFNLHINLRDFKKSLEALKTAEQINGLNEEDLITLDRSYFNYFTLIEDYISATKYMSIVNKKISKLKDHTQALFYLDIWDYGIIFKRYDLCQHALAKMKSQKNYVLAQHYNYMKVLLMHLLEDKPVYIVQSDFNDYPDLLEQLKLIRALECNQISEAVSLWDILHQKKPFVFGMNYECLGQKTILSRCIDKHRSKLIVSKPNVVRDKGVSITDSIEKVLMAHDQMSKEDLFLHLYGRLPETKDDYNRLARDIYKFKMNKNVEVRSKSGMYSLKKKVS